MLSAPKKVLFNTEGVERRGGGGGGEEEEMTEEGTEGTLHPAGVSVHPRGFLYTPGSINRPTTVRRHFQSLVGPITSKDPHHKMCA